MDEATVHTDKEGDGLTKVPPDSEPVFTPEEVFDLLAEAEADAEASLNDVKETRPEGFLIPARFAAIAMSFVALSCLTALVLVATTKSADGLSTIALSLAILAFVVQIIVFIYQSVGSNQQMLQSEQVFTETRALLTEVKTAAHSTEVLVRDQFQDILKAFLESQPGGKQEAKFLSALRTELASSHPQSPVQQSPRARATTLERAMGRGAKHRTENAFFSFPTEDEGMGIVAEMKDLSPRALRRIRELGQDLRVVTGYGMLNQVGEPLEPGDKELEDADLTRTARIVYEGEPVTVSQLTDKGEAAANILLATGEIPDYARDFLASRDPDEP